MMMKLLGIFTLLLIAFLLCTSGAITENYNTEIPCDEKLECCTPQCKLAAHVFKESMNTSVDPCDNFYLFACGGYINKSTIPRDQKYVSRFTDMQSKLNETYSNIVKSVIEESDTFSMKIMKTFYQSCMNEEEIAQNSTKALLHLLESLGGWPVLSETWNGTGYSLYHQLLKVSLIGPQNFAFFNIDLNHRSIYLHRLLTILEPGPFCQGLENKKVQAYYKFMVSVVTALGGKETAAKIDMWEVVKLEYNLTRIFCYEKYPQLDEFMADINATQMNNGGIRVKGYDLIDRFFHVKFRDLDYYIPGFPWQDFINATFADFYNVKDNDNVYVGMPFGVIWAAHLMNTVSNRTLSNLLLWRTVYDLIPSMNAGIRELRFNFSISIDLKDDLFTTRDQQCLSLLKTSFSSNFLSPLLRNIFTENYMTQAKSLMGELQYQLIESVSNMSWVSNFSRKEAIRKAASIKQHIEIPNVPEYSEPILKAIKKLNFNGIPFVEILLHLLRYDTIRRNFNKKAGIRYENRDLFGKKGDLMEFYKRSTVRLDVPVGYLQEVLFDTNITEYINYGGIGLKISHCMGHAFDDQGIEYNHEGRFDQWADKETRANHAKIINCLKKQYINTTEEQIWSNDYEETKFDENFSDNFALQVAYKAFIKTLNETKSNKRLPGLNFTAQQMFWLQEANSNCEKRAHDYVLLGRYHKFRVPRVYRVNIPLGNSLDFRRDWMCSSKTKMGSQEICDVW